MEALKLNIPYRVEKVYDRCAYLNCRKGRHPSNGGVQLFHFPAVRDEIRLAIWVTNCGNPQLNNWSASTLRRSGICGDHFTGDSFITQDRTRLKRNAIPIHYKQAQMQANTKEEIVVDPDFDFAIPDMKAQSTNCTLDDKCIATNNSETKEDYSNTSLVQIHKKELKSECQDDESAMNVVPLEKENKEQNNGSKVGIPSFVRVYKKSDMPMGGFKIISSMPVYKVNMPLGNLKTLNPIKVLEVGRSSKAIKDASEDSVQKLDNGLQQSADQPEVSSVISEKADQEIIVPVENPEQERLKPSTSRRKYKDTNSTTIEHMYKPKPPRPVKPPLGAVNVRRLLTQNESLKNKNINLRKTIKRLRRKLRRSIERTTTAVQISKIALKQRQDIDCFLDSHDCMSPGARAVVKLQVHRPNTSYSKEEKDFAQKLYTISPTNYIKMRKFGLNFPGESTVKMWISMRNKINIDEHCEDINADDHAVITINDGHTGATNIDTENHIVITGIEDQSIVRNIDVRSISVTNINEHTIVANIDDIPIEFADDMDQ
ncbi:uncharacterized protein LOC105704268 isoform X2 [Orussus abietinus]|uniref:uncharacterized protein LOC105704268 isoform X2 n=1 Tax=Orussus abietinus TaxID=222816 RepID=UPI000625DDBA|nr:uncharacterized protein LOC105704268 isoform X2 [Orussus abietinus]